MRPLGGSLLPAVGACFPGYAASKSINTGVNHADKDGLYIIYQLLMKPIGSFITTIEVTPKI